MADPVDDLRLEYLQLGEAVLELRRVRRDGFTENDTNLACFGDADRALIAADAALYTACTSLGVPAVRVRDTGAGGEDGRTLSNAVLGARALDHIRRVHVRRAEVVSLFEIARRSAPDAAPLSNALGPVPSKEAFSDQSAERLTRIVQIVVPLAILFVVLGVCALGAFYTVVFDLA